MPKLYATVKKNVFKWNHENLICLMVMHFSYMFLQFICSFGSVGAVWTMDIRLLSTLKLLVTL